jgi:hypothetical protein
MLIYSFIDFRDLGHAGLSYLSYLFCPGISFIFPSSDLSRKRDLLSMVAASGLQGVGNLVSVLWSALSIRPGKQFLK